MTRYQLQIPSIIGTTTMEKLFEDFWGDTQRAIQTTTAGYPVTDIYKDEDGNQIIEMALAGFTEEMLDISIEDNKIQIQSYGTKEDNERVVSKIARRAFKKQFVDYSHNLDLASSDARFENGLLRIKIPPKNNFVTKQIKINKKK